MPADPRTDALFEQAQQLLDQLKTAIENKDVAAQRLLAVKLAGLETGFKRIETTKRVMLANMMAAVRRATTPDKRRKELLDAFEYTARVRSTAQDDLVDDALSAEAEAQLKEIISGLDALKPEGRKALAPFLDSFDLDVRVCAAVALLELMPDRVIPILRDLVKNAPGTNAGATALATLDELGKHAK